MSVCQAKHCKKRHECMKYENNYFKYNQSEYWEQLIDWSTYGCGGMSQDTEGNSYIHYDYTCGDDSITYPLFEQIPIENDYTRWKIWLDMWNVKYKEMQLSPSPKIVKLMIGGAYGYAAIYFKDNKFMYIDACD